MIRDANPTSMQLRGIFSHIKVEQIGKVCFDECLNAKPFEQNGTCLAGPRQSGGSRLGFDVEYGLYRRKTGKIGFDGSAVHGGLLRGGRLNQTTITASSLDTHANTGKDSSRKAKITEAASFILWW